MLNRGAAGSGAGVTSDGAQRRVHGWRSLRAGAPTLSSIRSGSVDWIPLSQRGSKSTHRWWRGLGETRLRVGEGRGGGIVCEARERGGRAAAVFCGKRCLDVAAASHRLGQPGRVPSRRRRPRVKECCI